MDKDEKIYILAGNEQIYKALGQGIEQSASAKERCVLARDVSVVHDPDAPVIVIGDVDTNTIGNPVLALKTPFKWGVFLDRLCNVQTETGRADPIEMHGYIFNVQEYSLKKGSKIIRLTEKERDILLTLFNAADRSVSREALLQTVWGYVEGLETHTLETHIYRLRQKIETDPSEPKIVLTTEDGYTLG